MAEAKNQTTDAVKILRDRYIKNNSKRLRSVQEEREKADIAVQIYEMRSRAGLTQKELADLVNTTQSVISRLEDADYTGHTLKMLDRIASALHCRVEIRFVAEDQNLALA